MFRPAMRREVAEVGVGKHALLPPVLSTHNSPAGVYIGVWWGVWYVCTQVCGVGIW